ncbi:Uncharacterised protein [Vibrio cholerae]|nr:Uncharacterised protein [Vibrio cholerae]CSB94353.1 Uncharacterised protein [Vibrio cholerae]CSI00830.1 Uncharacterised protein [Vibrio cholerae]
MQVEEVLRYLLCSQLTFIDQGFVRHRVDIKIITDVRHALKADANGVVTQHVQLAF